MKKVERKKKSEMMQKESSKNSPGSVWSGVTRRGGREEEAVEGESKTEEA